MTRSSHGIFGVTFVVGILASFALGAVLTPPDPFTQVRYAAGAVPIALLVAYLLAYRGGYEYLRGSTFGGRDA